MNVFGRLVPLLFAFSLGAQTSAPPADAWQSLHFLEGTWQARTLEGSAGNATGTYTFAKELKGHVLARHSAAAGCTGPETFDCQHGDLLYIFEERSGQAFEGHLLRQ